MCVSVYEHVYCDRRLSIVDFIQEEQFLNTLIIKATDYAICTKSKWKIKASRL